MKKTFFIFLLLICCSLTAITQRQPDLYKKAARDPRMEQWVDSVFKTLSLGERIGQLFVLGVETRNTDANRSLLKKYVDEYKIGGILFTSGDALTQAELTNYAQSLAKTPLMITLDGEWGLSMRLKDTPRFPKNMTLGALDNDSLIFEYGKEVGRQCRRMGIHVNFAPVLDVNSNPENPVIGNRSFGENPQVVARKAISYARGIESEGILTTAKHFPGHGDTSDDSHYTLPVISRNRNQLEEIELLPFKRYIEAGLSGIMVGHLSVPALDPATKLPSSLSPLIVDSLLHREMGFNGLIFTDALEMKGVTEQKSNALLVLKAGNDILLKPAVPAAQIEQIISAIENGTLSQQLIDEKCRKVLRYKYLCGLNRYKPIEKRDLITDLNNSNSAYLIGQLNERAITLLGNDSASIPFQNLNKRRIAAISIGENDLTPFQEQIGLYAPVRYFNVTLKTSISERNKILSELEYYNTVIISIHTKNKNYLPILNEICRKQGAFLVFFTDPYLLLDIRKWVKQAKGVVMAYENTPSAQESAAQLLFGGIPAQGKLPVSLKGLYAAGHGLPTTSCRLGYTTPEAVGMKGSILSEIEQIVNEGISKKAYPGCQVLIAHKGKIVYNRAFGYFDYANTKRVLINDVYDLASVTKTTATLPSIMKLASDGKIKLTEKLSQYVPELKGTDKADITFYDALFHESGMPPSLPMYELLVDPDSYSGSLYKSRRDATYRLQIGDKCYVNNNIKLRRDLVSTVKSPEYPIPVGENLFGQKGIRDTIFNRIVAIKRLAPKYRYSCLNFILLRKVVENIAHQSIDRYTALEFYRSLGAPHTTYTPLERGIARSAIAPTENDLALRRQILIGYAHDETAGFGGGIEGNAGLFSNANDLAKLLQLYLNDGSYGGRQYVRTDVMRQFTTQSSKISRRGLGFDKPDGEGYPCPEAPASVYGHTGYTGTCFWIDPDNDLIYIFLSNRVYPHRWYTNLFNLNIRTRIMSAIYKSMK